MSEFTQLPEAVSNNAVCEGFVDGIPYLYSFGGIDTSKKYTGIHLRSYRVNLLTGKSERIDDLPDTLGKIAAAASRIGNIIYICGGYHVFENHSEKSSNKCHRFDILKNRFIEDGANIPVATDDHVQVVFRDSLLYLITGWSDRTNIPNVQIYDPKSNSWQIGTPLTNNNVYKSFGASGVLLHDTIYFFGGASSGPGFPIQNRLRVGIVNASNPTEIQWNDELIDVRTKGYRMAACSVKDQVHWIGGSEVTYNYDGIAYNGSGIVDPAKRDLYLRIRNHNWQSAINGLLPMDLRGIAELNDSVKFIAGGMINNAEVSKSVIRLEWNNVVSIRQSQIEKQTGSSIFMRHDQLGNKIFIEANDNLLRNGRYEIFNMSGLKVVEKKAINSHRDILIGFLAPGTYVLKVYHEKNIFPLKFIKK